MSSPLPSIACARVLAIGWRPATTQALEAEGCSVTYVLKAREVAVARASGFTGRIVTVPDPCNAEHVLAGLARAGLGRGSFDAVGTNLEPALVTASIVGQHLDARAIPVRVAILLRDKVAQKNAVRAAGLPVTRCATVDAISGVVGCGLDYPLVIKPLAGAATVDTFALRNDIDVRDLADSPTGRTSEGPWAVEEFVEGTELHIDGAVRDGELTFLAVSRYLENLLSIRDGDGIVGSVLLDRDTHVDLYERAQRLTTSALQSLGHTDGVFHLEAFDQGDRLVFSECGGRTSGGMTREELRRKFGIDLVAEWARALTGLTPNQHGGPLDKHHYGWLHLVAPAGTILSKPETREVLALPGVVEASIEAHVGDASLGQGHSTNVKAGRIIANGASEAEVAQRLREAAAWFAANTVVRTH